MADFRSRFTAFEKTPPRLPSMHKLLSNAIFTLADKVKVHISALYRYREWGLPA